MPATDDNTLASAGISGHIIRRTDTDAVSASSLFRSAFPYASNEAEAAEMKFVAARYDTVKVGSLSIY